MTRAPGRSDVMYLTVPRNGRAHFCGRESGKRPLAPG